MLRNHIRQTRAFSLIELVIVVVIIGIIAAIAIPRMSRGSAGTADAALVQDLSLLRNAIDLYQTEHNGLYPAATGSVTVDQLLLQYSDISGQNISTTKDTGPNQVLFGPYLRTIPTMPVGSNKGAKGIAVSTTSGVTPSGGPGIAWLYNAADGTLKAYTGTVTNDSAGNLYSSY
jgi:prepilin-type N-terminal cleavage/methylation domain-containing protein